MTQIDIMGNNFALSAERESIGFYSEKQVDMSAFMVQIAVPKNDKYTWEDAFRFIAPFSNDVWLAFFGCMVISAVVVFVLDWSFHVQHRDELEKLIDMEATKIIQFEEADDQLLGGNYICDDLENGESMVKGNNNHQANM
jgi:hypothetical protein